MDAQLSEADVVLNRTNIALARSQRLIQSWLPPRSQAQEGNGVGQDEDDYMGMSEVGGLGSKSAYEDEGLPDGASKRAQLSSNDKLLEQLLGKKAAQARKKSQHTKQGILRSNHAASKPVESEVKAQRVESDEEEEEGRATVFKSRKSSAKQNVPLVESHLQNGDGLSGDTEDGLDKSNLLQDEDSPLSREERAQKRKGGSYLDEVLSQKARKKGKNKKHHV